MPQLTRSPKWEPHVKTTLSIIKADIGSIGGHICPSRQVLESVRNYIAQHGSSLLIDHYNSSTGDDIAILMSHRHGAGRCPGVRAARARP